LIFQFLCAQNPELGTVAILTKMQAIAFLLTLLLPALLVYFIRYENQQSSPETLPETSSKKKKKSKKKTSKQSESTKTPAAVNVKSIPDPESKQHSTPVKEKDVEREISTVAESAKAPEPDTKEQPSSFVQERTKKAAVDSEVSRMTIDEHMDATPRFSRVMRIRTDEPVTPQRLEPLEPGWNRTISKGMYLINAYIIAGQLVVTLLICTTISSFAARSPSYGASANSFETLTKKQRENQAKARKKKEEKAAMEAEQEARLRQHKRELEKLKINEFYSKGPGKKMVSQASVWGGGSGSGSPGSGKRPQGVASLNEQGKLIWD
jgi:hypothetical protein